MSNIINCKEIREKELEKLKEKDLSMCTVAFVQVGNNPSSNVYVRNKIKLCEELRIEVIHYKLIEKIKEEDLLDVIDDLNNDDSITGIMVQLPLPDHIREEVIIDAIAPEKDIDGFTTVNKGKLMVGANDAIIPCTPKGILTILEHESNDLKGKNVVIVGRSNIVGKPLANLLINKGATVTVCNSNTSLYEIACALDTCNIFISAIGKANYWNSYRLYGSPLKDTIAIDVGINRDEEGKLCGDIDKSTYDMFKKVTSVPGGVGVMTVLEVIRNIVELYERNKDDRGID